jgi:hypothetical protein
MPLTCDQNHSEIDDQSDPARPEVVSDTAYNSSINHRNTLCPFHIPACFLSLAASSTFREASQYGMHSFQPVCPSEPTRYNPAKSIRRFRLWIRANHCIFADKCLEHLFQSQMSEKQTVAGSTAKELSDRPPSTAFPSNRNLFLDINHNY